MTTVSDSLYHHGGVPVGLEVLQPPVTRWVYYSATAQPYKDLLARVSDANKLYSTLTLAHTAVTTARNEVIFLTPENHAQTAAASSTAAVTLSKSNVHYIGMGNGSCSYHPVAITDDGTSGTGHYNPMLSITGSYNSFRNIRFSFGNATNTNLNAIRIQGNGNVFENCFFDGPLSTTLADLATFDLVIVGGVGNTFRNCVFGTMWKTRSVANNLLQFKRSSGGTAARHTVFENCIFQSNVDNTGVTHIDENSENGGMYGPQYFRNCHLAFRWSDHADQVTMAIRHGSGGLTGQLHFDALSSIWGADDVCLGTVGRQAIIWGQSGATTTTLGLALNTT